MSSFDTDYNLRLTLPKTEFYPGEVTAFTIDISNPHGAPVEYLQLILIQTVISKLRGSFKVKEHQIAEQVNGPGFSALTWFYYIQIPPHAQLTQNPGEITGNSGRLREIVAIKYNFQVVAKQIESFSFKSAEYPIKIVQRRQHASNSGIQEVILPPGTMSNVPITGPRRDQRRNTFPAITRSNLLHPGGSGQGGRGYESISPPPRYSMLSLISNASVEMGKMSDYPNRVFIS